MWAYMEKQKPTVTDELLLALKFVFGPAALHALELVDRRSVTLVQSPSGRSLYQLPILDVMVEHKTNGELQTKVHRKATHTDQVLNFNSDHPSTHKGSCVRTLFKRATTHCSNMELCQEEEEYLFQVFKDNEYPKNRDGSKKEDALHEHQEDITCPDTLITLPYIRNTLELTTRLLRLLGIRVAHKHTSTLRQLLTQTKDPLPAVDRTNVIYKIPCRDCEKPYIGQTGRKLTTREHERQLATKRHDQYSPHLNPHGQGEPPFNWGNTKILGQAMQRHTGIPISLVLHEESH
ncbi:zinc finger SWIM domain-containing protein 7 isoform X2 [Stegostoma tigrinum]|uniref:zinc finger SWIM domain-containing protein 7 isoform X2 n=1 Tax=Stegostoma tigrinum TaxID=3053191 RepID=UPI00286FF5CA|nr:zinc finger SWIM domain-containing protein 7 isoform X2 [Stegostoma tigrinum]XP_059511454.1 zinc finger SWIM domain-containing protein 7 isoform X2 [Stegostoma tigrinum]